MSPNYQIRSLLPLIVSIIAFLVFACASPSPPQVGSISVQPEAGIPVSEEATLSIEASGTDLKFKWSATKGTITGEGSSVLYTAPDTPGPDAVTVEVTSAGGTVVKNLSIQVVAAAIVAQENTPTSTPTETIEPTSTPVPTSTPSPTSTNTPIPSATATPTLTPTATPTNTSLPPTGTPKLTPTPFYCTDNGSGGTEIITVEPPYTITEIHINLEERATEYGFSLWEVEIYGPNTGDTNLAIDATSIASSVQDDQGCTEDCEFAAKKAIDGDMNTRWSSDWRDGQTFTVTLSNPQVVNSIVLKWENAYARKYCVTIIEPVTLP